MWQRFTERARRVILLGQEEASRLNSAHVGTEHLLLGLMREQEGVAAQVLQKMGVSLNKVRQEIEAEVEPGSDPTLPNPKLTPKAKRVLELAADEARRMRHNYIGTEHLLLGLLREKDGLAAKVLRKLGLDLDIARTQVLEYLGPNDDETTAPPPAPSKHRAMSRKVRAQVDYNFHAAPELQALLIAAGAEAGLSGHYITQIEHVLLALLNSAHPLSDWLQEFGVDARQAGDSLRTRLQSTLPSAEQLARQEKLMELHAQKNAAIARDDYETAANLRDQIQGLQDQLQTDETKPSRPETEERDE